MKTARNKIKTQDFELKVKDVNKDGTFTGYGSVFNVQDQGGDIVMPGAFKNSLNAIKASGKKVPVLWQHKTDAPVGVYDLIEEDDNGLYVEGRLLVDAVQLAKEAFALLSEGAVTGLSIGYGTQRYEIDTETYVRKLLELDLWEVSLVTFPMNEEAQAQAVKNAIRLGNVPGTIREFEKFLRDAGFSKENAVTIASRGIKEVIERESGSKDTAEISDLLSNFKI